MFLVGVCETRFPSNRSRTLWISSPSILPAPLRGDAHDLPQLAGHDKAALDAYRADTRAHDAEEELRLGYVAFTRAAHRLSVTSYLWSPRATPVRTVGLPGRRARAARGVGRAGRRLADQAAEGRPQPLRRRRPVPAVAGHRGRRRGVAPDRGRAQGACRRPGRGGPGPRHDRGGPGRRLGRRARPAAGRGAGRPQQRRRGPAAEQPVRHRAGAGSATTRRRSPASWPGRCRGRRPPPPGSAPASTPGWRRGSASRTSSTTTTFRAAPTRASTTTPTSRS